MGHYTILQKGNELLSRLCLHLRLKRMILHRGLIVNFVRLQPGVPPSVS